MNLIVAALRRPLTVMVFAVTLVVGAFLAVGGSVFEQVGWKYPDGLPRGMEVDIFPSLNLPVIYVCQPYGGMDPAQMEGFLTNYYEYHFLYINGIHHVESRNVQGSALMKLYFHSGTNMAQAMAETINYVNRSQAFMPPGTVSPFVMRFDTGSVPVGYLVMSSQTRTAAEITDIGLFVVRPMFSSLPGVSAPPPFGGSARTIVVTVDPRRLQSYGMSPEEVVTAITKGNTISPSGNLLVGDKYPIVTVNSVVTDPQQLASVPIRMGSSPVYVRDVGYVADSADAPAGYALADGRRAVYILATKRADASTMSVITNIKNALPAMREKVAAAGGSDIQIEFQLDQSPYVTRAVRSVVVEGLLGACLVGLMVLVFLRDWRSALVVILNIPLAICGALIALWLTGETINVMTLGGLALAIGILVDEAAVEVENIHTQFAKTDSIALAVRLGNAQTAVPRLLAMLCILAVFIPAMLMQGAAQRLFAPLAMSVGFSMIGSYILSSTFVPVVSVWLLRHAHQAHDEERSFFGRMRRGYEGLLSQLVGLRWIVVPAYAAVAAVAIGFILPQLGQDIFPVVDAGQFRLRLRAPDGTQIARTERYAVDVLDLIKQEIGAENVALTLGYVGMIHSNFPVNAVYQWSRGPEEAILYVDLKEDSGVDVERLKETMRTKVAEKMPELRVSFEPSDIVNEVMSFGSPTPIEIAVSRFRETIPEPAPVDLDGASSRDALVAGFLDALEQNDIPALNRLLISRAEFAYLYFPSSIYMNRPYQQDPSLVWFMMINNSERGLRRVERGQRQVGQHPQPAQFKQKAGGGVLGRHLLAALGGEEQQARVHAVIDQIEQPVERLGVAPLQVVEQQDERLRVRRHCAQQGVVEMLALPAFGQRLRGGQRRVRSQQFGQQARQFGAPDRRDLGQCGLRSRRAQRIDQRRIAHVVLGAEGVGVQRADALLPRPVQQLFGDARLADAGFALDADHVQAVALYAAPALLQFLPRRRAPDEGRLGTVVRGVRFVHLQELLVDLAGGDARRRGQFAVEQ